jgi:DNA-binding XRE family transcriptional regulator
MTGNEFKTARKTRLKYSQEELGIATKTHKRTIQDIEKSDEVKGVWETVIELLIWKDHVTMQGIKEAVEIDLARRYPHGFQSAPGEE